MKGWVWAPVLIFTGITAGGLLAPEAHASPVDDVTFLQVLDERGITYVSASKIITAGHAVCDYLDLGFNLLATVNMVDENSPLGSESAYFVGVAVAAYCPGYARGVLA